MTRAGGFFFLTPDGRYLIKTLTRREQKRLLRMLPRYYEYLRRSPRTLLCRFYGCYAITMHSQSVYFVTMESLFHSALPLHEKYDLKGSWVDRSRRMPYAHHAARAGDQFESRGGAPPTRKDNDLTRKLRLTPGAREALRTQCAADAEMLCSLNVMDYSLLLGVHRPGAAPTTEGEAATSQQSSEGGAHSGSRPADGRGSRSSPLPRQPPSPAAMGSPRPLLAPKATGYEPPQAGPSELPSCRTPSIAAEGPQAFTASADEGGAVYYVGIIDLLQTWSIAKRVERFLKVALLCRCGAAAAGMSVIEPASYADRFVRMIDRILDQ